MAKRFWISRGCGVGATDVLFCQRPHHLPEGIAGFGRELAGHPDIVLLPADDDATIEVYRWMIDLGWEYHPLMTGNAFAFMKLLAARGLR